MKSQLEDTIGTILGILVALFGVYVLFSSVVWGGILIGAGLVVIGRVEKRKNANSYQKKS